MISRGLSPEFEDSIVERIEQLCDELRDPNSEAAKEFEAEKKRWEAKIAPLLEAIRQAEILTAADYRTYVSVVADYKEDGNIRLKAEIKDQLPTDHN